MTGVQTCALPISDMKIAALIDNRFDFDQSLADYRMESLGEIPGIARALMEM